MEAVATYSSGEDSNLDENDCPSQTASECSPFLLKRQVRKRIASEEDGENEENNREQLKWDQKKEDRRKKSLVEKKINVVRLTENRRVLEERRDNTENTNYSSLFANVFSSSNPPVENDFQPSPIKTLSRHSSYLQNGDQDECFPSMDFKEPSASPIKDFDELSLSPKKLFNEPQPSPEKENQNPYEDLSSSSSARYTPEDLPSPESKKRIPPPKTPPSPKKPKAEWTGLSQGHLEALVNIYPPINEEALSEIAKGLNYVYTMKQILEKGKRLNLFTIDEELEEKVLEKESKKDKEEKDQVFIDQVMKEGLSQNEQEGIQDFYYEHDQEVDEDNDDEKERYYQECLEAGMYQNRDQEDPDQHDDDDRQDFYQPEREDDDVYQQRYHREDRYQKGDSDGDAKHMDDAEYARHLQEQYYREEDSNDGYYRRNYRRQDYRRERYQREEYRQRDYDEADYQEEEYRSREDHEKAPEHEEVHMKKENEEEEMDIDVET